MKQHRIADATMRNICVSDRTIWRHVILTTDQGETSLGEASFDAAPKEFDDVFSIAAKSLVGRKVGPATLSPISSLLSQGLAGRTIHSALDQALSGLRAQTNSVPLARFLSPLASTQPIPLYANINRATSDRSPQGFSKNAVLAAKQGYGAIKMAPFDGLSPAICEAKAGQELISKGIGRLKAVATAVPGVDLMVDCHWRFTASAARGLLPALAEIGVMWLECPLPETTGMIEELRQLRNQSNALGMRLCGLETFGGWPEFAPFVTGGAYDVIMPDVKHAGSLASILETAERAKEFGVSTSLHNPSGPVAHLVSVHVSGALGGEEILEVQWGESELFFKITNPAPVLEYGCCIPSIEPGLGTVLL